MGTGFYGSNDPVSVSITEGTHKTKLATALTTTLQTLKLAR